MKNGNNVAQTKFDNCTLRDINTTTVLATGFDVLGYSFLDTIAARLTCPKADDTFKPITAEGSLGIINLRTLSSTNLPKVPIRLGKKLGNQAVSFLCGDCKYVQPIAE